MSATIKIKNSSTAGAAPTSSDLVQGELAVNVTDKRLFTENASGTVVELGTNPSVPVTFPDGSASAPSLTNSGDTNTGIFFPAADTIAFAEGGTETMRLDSAGNMGLGVTPSAWSATVPALQIGSGGSFLAGYGVLAWVGLGTNAHFNGTNWIYKTSATASYYQQSAGVHSWYSAASGTAGNAISFTQAMTLDSSGNLGIGTTSPAYTLDVNGTMRLGSAGSIQPLLSRSSAEGGLVVNTTAGGGAAFIVQNNGTEQARIDSSGNLLVGTTSGSSHVLYKATSSTILTVTSDTGTDSVYINGVGSTGANLSQGAAIYAQKNTTSGRSINAAGTINASGADYAEYMIKAGDFTIAKGDVCGIDANGKLTNMFADAVSFVVKSTNPSYVGNDGWGADLGDDEAAIESVRQTLDRIAFCGQVPVNVTGATPGQFIIPVNDNGAIKGQAVSNPTFEQYQIAVGKVIAIEQDGRAKIIVKVA